MAQTNRIKVVIDGVIYELSSSESVEYIQTVSNYIDRKIKSIYSVKSEGAINPSLRTLFISLNIADDLFKEKERVRELEREAVGLRKEIAAMKGKLEKIEKVVEGVQPKKPEADNEKPKHGGSGVSKVTPNNATHRPTPKPVTNNVQTTIE